MTSLLDRLERKFGRLAITNLTYYLIAGQVIIFLLSSLNPQSLKLVSLTGANVLSGEFWRVLTFLWYPITDSYLWAIFVWYLYFLYGTALENQWGAFRYNVYVLISYLSTVVAALLFPNLAFTNTYLYTSIFLAFAHLYPEFTLYLFFVVPIKVRWLAYLAWAGTMASLILGPLPTKIVASVSVGNFLLFFGKDILRAFSTETRRLRQKSMREGKGKPYHVCVICKRNEIDNPEMEIRYCNECEPVSCYCEKHIGNHTHLSLQK